MENDRMTLIIVAGGSCEPGVLAEQISRIERGGEREDTLPEEKDRKCLLLGLDAGVLTLEAAGFPPDHVLGDFDSVSTEERSRILSSYPQQTVLDPVKDDTDLEAALRWAMKKRPKEILIFGATGSRMDHTMANLQLLSLAEAAGVPAVILDPGNRIRMIRGTVNIDREKQYGRYISLIPVDGELKGVTLTGVKYPLQEAVIPFGLSLGVSNEITADRAEIRIREGRAFLMETRD